ncbi:hypothetical protein B0H21DRAFT_691833 [Amylocystis lapponica]|nr:hypothetical protein B0H21DRAFT_691833 [Amylocystis lapponica]
MPETAELKPSLHDAAPLSLTIIPVAYQDQSHLRNSIDDAEPTVVEPPSDVPLATADVMHQTGDRIPESLSLPEALRMIVITRIRCDRQTRDERINPVLYANRATVEIPHTQSSLSCQELLQDIFAGERGQSMQDAHERLKPSLAIRFSQRQAILTEKVQILRAEYLALHERWLAHCAKLDDVAKAHALEEAAATAGRTTRRSAALGDAVRSDLEMEQIIASLGNEELTDANHLSARNAAGIPDMVSVTRGTVDYLYDDTNNVVDAPLEFYAHRTGIDDWTNEEKDIFLAQFALHPKQFGIIADSLPHKTAAQCVVYYYLHKKTFINFRKVVNRQANGKRKRGGRRTDKGKGNALLTDIRRHDDEMSRGSTPSGATTRRKRANPTANTEPRKTRKTVARIEESPISTPTPDPEPEPRRRRRRPIPTARAVASVEQEADVPPEVEHKPARKGRRGRKIKSSELVNSPIGEEPPVLVHETRFIDQTELISRKKSASGSVAVPRTDHIRFLALFLRLLGQHGDDFKRIAASMPNKARTTIQVSTFYKHHLAELDLEKVAASAPKRSPTPDSTPDIWKEASFPGSGVITPNTSSSTPAEEPPLRTFPILSQSSNYVGSQSGLYGSTGSTPATYESAPSSSTSAPLTMTFPSNFAYSNLSPSHFTGDIRPSQRSTTFRDVSPPGTLSSSTMTFDASMFPQQPWIPQSSLHNKPALPTPGLPATLQTTEDLRAYLEHQASLGRHVQSDFDLPF